MGLFSVVERESEKALEALPTALEAESRNGRPQRQRILMARLRGHTDCQCGPPRSPGAAGCINYSSAFGLILPSWFS